MGKGKQNNWLLTLKHLRGHSQLLEQFRDESLCWLQHYQQRHDEYAAYFGEDAPETQWVKELVLKEQQHLEDLQAQLDQLKTD